MAKRRLNKKVALVGSVIFIVVALGAILAILYLSRNPEKLAAEGDAAWKAKDYERAEHCYHKARNLAKTDSLRKEILFKLVDMYIETGEWNFVRGCWEEIINIDHKEVKARYARLKYFYIMADSGVQQVWQDVRQQASELIEVVEQANLLMESTDKWETAGLREKRDRGQPMGQYLYLLRGRAAMEMAKLGVVPDTEALLAQGVADLEKAQKLDPTDVDAYWYLAQAALTKGDIFAERGNFEERNKAIEQAKSLMEQAVKVADADPRAHMNLLVVKFLTIQKVGKEEIDALEREYLSLAERFPSNAEIFARISRFYSDPRMGPKNFDKAIEAIEQATKLDSDNVIYAINAAYLRYRKFSYYGQKDELSKAIEVAKHALTLPDAQEQTGPRSWTNRLNRVSLYALLANCYIEQVLEPCEKRTEAQTAVWLKDAEEAVHGIEQILGSGEDPQVIKWRGLLELAKGDKNSGIRKLYTVYEQFKAASTRKGFERIDSLLAYRLAKNFENTEELGAANEFFSVALRLSDRNLPDRIDERKPEAFLDYAEVLLKLRVYNEALHLVNFFESQYWSNERSRMIRVKAYIGAKQFDDATEELGGRPDNPDTVKLRLELVQAKIRQTLMAIVQKQIQERSGSFAQPVGPAGESAVEPQASMEVIKDELKSYRQREAELVGKLLSMEPDSVEAASVVTVCGNYLEAGQKSEAEDLINKFLAHFPDNTMALVYKQLFSEPDPANVSEQRRREIEEQVLSSIANPIRRAVELGVFYRGNNEPQKAIEQLKAAFEMGASPDRISDSAVRQLVIIASQHLFDMALKTQDWQLAGQIADKAQRENLDECEGRVFAARLALAKGEFKDALAKIDECLKQKPVFSRAYMLRSNINAALGDEHASIEDIKKAASLNPLDGTITKGLAIAFCRRDQKLGDNIASAQRVETKAALDRALVLNAGDLQLLSFYAEYISSIEPLRALAIRQELQRTVPSVENAVRLGQLAAKVAGEITDPQRKDALFAIAESSFEEARKINPNDKEMLYYYAEYLRSRGQDDKAKSLLKDSQDERLLSDYYFQSGRYDDARRVLEQLYQSGTKDITVLKRLLLVAEKTADGEAVKKYSEELLSLEENAENRLIQIQSFLRVGFVKEAEFKVQSFKEKYPDDPRIQLLEALLVMRQGQLQKALDLTNQYIQNNQNNAVAWRMRGEIKLYMANYEQAIGDLKASKSLLDDPATRVSLAQAYMRMKRFDDAIAELKNTIDLPNAPVETRRLLEGVYMQVGRKDALKTFYDQTLAKFPDSVPWHNRAAAFAITVGEFKRAEQLYEKAYQMKRKDIGEPNAKDGIRDTQYAAAFDGHLRALVLGAGNRSAGDWNPRKLEEVFEEGKRHLDGAFAPIAYLRMAEAKLKLGDKTTAREYCRKAVDKVGENESLASDVLLRMYLMLGAEEVSKYCQQKLQTDPASLAANFTMYNLAKLDAQYDKAIEYIDKCLQIVGQGNPRVVEYVTRKAEVLTLAYEETSDNNYLLKAIADYESLLAKMPNNTSVLNNLAYLLAENDERLPEALQYAKRALDARPNDPSFMDTYGYVLYKSGDVSKAEELLVAAVQRYEQDVAPIPPEVYEHLGVIKEKLGAKTEALDAYKQVLEVGADRLSQKRRERINNAVKRLSQ
jgi:tetratricopeptide (TPR) repeat protein